MPHAITAVSGSMDHLDVVSLKRSYQHFFGRYEAVGLSSLEASRNLTDGDHVGQVPTKHARLTQGKGVMSLPREKFIQALTHVRPLFLHVIAG